MIVSFRHKGLKLLFERSDRTGIRPDMLDKVRTILSQLDQSQTVEDMRLTSFRLHPLKGNRKGFGSVAINANWRIIFRFEDGDAKDVELTAYH